MAQLGKTEAYFALIGKNFYYRAKPNEGGMGPCMVVVVDAVVLSVLWCLRYCCFPHKS